VDEREALGLWHILALEGVLGVLFRVLEDGREYQISF
jgi:hypothetical protein